MWPSVRQAFTPFTVRFEGVTTWLYLDVKRLATIAIGDLVDPIETALGLPFVHPDGTAASRDEIAAAWRTVKARPDLAPRGGGAFAPLTSIRLTPQGIDDLVGQRIAIDEAFLRKRFPAFDSWPADAQLATLSIAWAAGPGWHAPHFDAAVAALDFATCAGKPGDANVDPSVRGEAWLNDTGNPGLRPRNLANRALMFAAAASVANGADPSVLCGLPAAS